MKYWVLLSRILGVYKINYKKDDNKYGLGLYKLVCWVDSDNFDYRDRSTFFVQLFSKKRKRALLFENVECKLYQAKEHDRVALCVYYDGVKQQSNLVVLKAKLTNTGQEDLSKSVLADPIKLLCGEGYRIINAMVVGEYEKIRPSLMWSPDSVELSWDLSRL